tara:strand:+ start:392 stop:982 length:591 start_codon:yes stop_codon:yes gene_type:complete
MELISHRINSIKALCNTHKKYGVEVDIRSYGDELIIAHDPFSNFAYFKKWIKFYDHGTLVLNVKEDGLEDKLLKELVTNNIKNFFFLDQAFPSLIKTIKLKEKRCAVRLSEYESIQTVLNLKDNVDWVWIDFFTKFPLDYKSYNLLKENKFKLCLVSPELHGYNEIETINLKEFLKQQNILLDAVCTNFINLWEDP